ncbi:aminotransferase class I/II-fold pyridoxal phosphate-dependent enzyme [Tenggerimyces flavus]|uniref:Aminotransferase class I/II-fold pyridoxal phosphate-dependent enzyme n=1 Tax=Tenggerimyces flavus TaxID=1708749 RepID=A0ABV7Y5M6_9ACTN|nr:aminotransferase class I/II-fold pyridoxal phosphate-dependent enzyme [Tenggerimyces flavus]MBM7790700.1 DNA-binding transcriptional MocR family regulator [Tenggerimyces flavus]
MEVQYRGSTRAGIAESIEAAVRSGQLAPGDLLPPVRRLAGELRVSPATVAAAYRDLRERAVVETTSRSGTKVRSRPALGGGRVRRRLSVPPGARDLAGGGPDPRLLPPLAPRLARVAADPAWNEPLGYDDDPTVPELVGLARERLAADGVPVDGATLAVTGGAMDGIERILSARLQPGDKIAVEDPGWTNLVDLLVALRLELVPVPIDDDGPTTAGLAAALEAGARAMVITSRAQNPTGAAVTAERAAELRAVLAKHPSVLVIEDDHAAELSEQSLAPLVGSTESWAFVRSASKPYGPDLRVAVIAGDETTLGRLVGRQVFGAGWVSTVLQRLVLDLWQDAEVSRLVAAAKASYARRRTGLIEALAARGVPAVGRSGINVWIPVEDETSVATRLRDAGWVVAPGSAFRLEAPPAIRVSVSALDEDEVEAFAEVVADAVFLDGNRFLA